MAEPLEKWRGPAPTFSPNTAYRSAGEVTVTMSVEMAAYILGAIGAHPGTPRLPNGQELNLYGSFYADLNDLLRAQQLDLEEVRAVGRDARPN